MTAPTVTVHRLEVSPAPGQADPIGESLVRDAAAAGVHLASARATHVYLIEAVLTAQQLDAVQRRILRDPVTEVSRIGAAPHEPGTQVVEVHPLPGVMDPVAQSVQECVRDLLDLPEAPAVSTGWRFDLSPAPGAALDAQKAAALAARLLANPVIQRVATEPYHPGSFPRSAPHDNIVREVDVLSLDEARLQRLSREAHLFLSLDEMRAVQAHYRALGRNPREIELETLAQTWSEHCVHKTLKSTIRFRRDGAAEDPIDWSNRPGHEVQPDGSILIRNLLKSTVAAATHRLIADGIDWTPRSSLTTRASSPLTTSTRCA